MPRKYKQKPGSRAYATTYSQETLSNPMKECLTGRMSVRKASRQFGIPLGTLQNKCKNRHSKKVGTPLCLSNETETHLVTSINTLSHWKSPLTSIDINLL